MLYGRAGETTAVTALLDSARDGEGGALALRGQAGVGKSALLDLAASLAVADGMRVLRADGIEPESDLAFAALHQLLRPVTGLLDALPGPQRDALSAALGLADTPHSDRFLVGAGALSLLAEAAAPDGLLCLVDDVQWVDRASADALLFAARRLRTERVAVLFSVRGDAPLTGVPELRVGGLDEESCAALLATGGPVAPDVVRRLAALTGGNPLVLREGVAALSPAQLAGQAPLPDPLPGGEQLFGEQVARLSPAARRFLLLASLEADLALVVRAGAAAAEVLHEVEAAGLVTVADGTVRFRHPLVRSAAHAAATSAEVRAAHATLAGLVTGDRRALHLAAAALGPDEPIAAELAAAAGRARERGGHGDAATAFARAAELTPDPLRRAGRLKDAATAAWLAGRPGQAQSHLAEARELAERGESGEGGLLEEIAQLRGRFELNSGDASEAVRILSAGEGIELLADASEAAGYVGDVPAIVELGRRASRHPPGFLRDVVTGIGAMLEDGSGGELLRGALARTGELSLAAELLWASAAASYLGESDVSAELVERAGRVARVSGMVGQLPVVLEFVATGERFKGRLAESAAVAEEGLQLAREAGYTNSVAAHLANLAVVAALRGEEERCRDLAEEALAIAVPHRIGLRAGVAGYALALLDLGLGRYAAAHARFAALAAAGPGAGHPTVTWRSTPDRVEAALAAGEHADAAEALAAYERWVAHAVTDEARALLARCRALLAAPGADAELFEEALSRHGEPVERARTALLYGERLRRAQRPGQARNHLRAALETFERLGAAPWAERARGELRAAGEAAARPAAGDPETVLTPQELRIARLVAEGASSKEVAARLFLSPRTVEYHLYKIYPKLGVTTRTELARLLVTASSPTEGVRARARQG
ncbi:Putative HTH-type transcriptional regulator [Nonomuraea coxensis DSM 45129]|uniref:HTH-type transcriptional regulator n=1 Tax=Nonomuraea coxensis DSM 45129 TaxID=1122611 RepID=A0ABX8UE81_9ACTN|nr:LuxR family transcriptional regulator [Nonomuraea coxensis]QYC45915.1 Putative HTH-type transcriptional regulator [Nonomuraea coxensis DSM 45129]